MKSVKTIGLAALVAVAALSIVGVSPAMAENTQACTVHEEPCEKGRAVTSDTLHLAGIWLLEGIGGFDILCLALLSILDFSSLGQPQSVTILTREFKNCGTEGTGGSHSNCSKVEATNLPWSGTLLKTGLNKASYEITSTNSDVIAKCSKFGFIVVECEFYFGELSFSVQGATGENNGLISEEGSLPKIAGGSLCPEEAKITSGTLEPSTVHYMVG